MGSRNERGPICILVVTKSHAAVVSFERERRTQRTTNMHGDTDQTTTRKAGRKEWIGLAVIALP